VTLKAQQSAEYVDYLAHDNASGGDEEYNKKYYDIKLKATKLLLDNIGNTFVTPVFNGSASVRDAAGQMIENVAKSVRRKETVDDAYMRQLEKDITALYRLDSLAVKQEKAVDAPDLGKLPESAAVLIGMIAMAWLALLARGVQAIIKKREQKKS